MLTRYMGYLPYIGATVMILSAFYIWKIYVLYLERIHLFSRAFLAALTDLREKMRCYLDSPRAWSQGYRDPLLEECGFLRRVRDGEDISAVYRDVRERIDLACEVDDLLLGCFSRLGEGYLDTELEAISAGIDKLRLHVDRYGEELTKKRKVAGALIGACASGIVILVI